MIWRIARRKHNVVLVFGKQAKVLREMLDPREPFAAQGA